MGVDGCLAERVESGEGGGETPGGPIPEAGGIVAVVVGGARAGTKGIGAGAAGEPKSCR